VLEKLARRGERLIGDPRVRVCARAFRNRNLFFFILPSCFARFVRMPAHCAVARMSRGDVKLCRETLPPLRRRETLHLESGRFGPKGAPPPPPPIARAGPAVALKSAARMLRRDATDLAKKKKIVKRRETSDKNLWGSPRMDRPRVCLSSLAIARARKRIGASKSIEI